MAPGESNGAAVVDFFPPQDRAAFAAMIQDGHTHGVQAELQIQAADGSLLPVYLAVAPLPLSEVNALCMVVTDLTDQKKSEDLQKANQRKDEFLAMLAHELRNPLAPIRNSLEIISLPEASASSGGNAQRR